MTTSASKILRRRYLKNKPGSEARIAKFKEIARVACDIYEIRTNAGLTQEQLATLIGTSRSVISLLENSEYEGHSLAMLRRIAEALNHRVECRFASFSQIEAEAVRGVTWNQLSYTMNWELTQGPTVAGTASSPPITSWDTKVTNGTDVQESGTGSYSNHPTISRFVGDIDTCPRLATSYAVRTLSLIV